MHIQRIIEKTVLANLKPNKVLLILGARRVGKTELIRTIIPKLSEPYLLLNGEDMDVQDLLNRRSVENYKRLLGENKILIIDEAQEVPEIGKKLKLIVDNIEGVKVIATGSSVFDLSNELGEPLVGRKKTIELFPVSQQELMSTETLVGTKANLEERLILGSYPELFNIEGWEQKEDYLREQVNSYLLKDILTFEGIKKRDKILQLLRIIAFRIGKEISIEGIGNELGISKNTVEKYLDLLSKVFILYKVTGFSRNLDNEITKKNRWYFYDNGIRNAVISGFRRLSLRDDHGELWENYLVSERLKCQAYGQINTNNYFWRTHTKQEIDWIEERSGKISAFEFKWNPRKKGKVPSSWTKGYPHASFKQIDPDNYLDFIT